MGNTSPFPDDPAGQESESADLELFSDKIRTSPFDAIRQEDEDGEFWSARDFMPHLDYGRWERFEDAIQRAMMAAKNSGADPVSQFRPSAKITYNARGQRREVTDYRLTRYAAYLLAMNSDPRKAAVAAAQTYFAAKTREAELASPPIGGAPSQLPDLTTAHPDVLAFIAQLGQAAATASQAALRSQERLKELEPAAALANTYAAANGTMTLQTFARTVQQWATQRKIKVNHDHVFAFLGQIGMVIRTRTRSDCGQATSTAVKAGWCENATTDIKTKTRGTILKTYAKMTPEGVDHAWKRIFATVGEFGTLDPAIVRPQRPGIES